MRQATTATYCLLATLVVASGLTVATEATVESEVAEARRLAGEEFASSFFLCGTEGIGPVAERLAKGPERLPPTKVFDNLWFIGNDFIGVWVLETGEGLILLDAGQSEREVRDHIEPGLRSVGLDPADIRYALITHGHWDHYGGSRYLQERYGTRILMGADDWDLVARSKPGSLARAPYFGENQADRPPPRRDIEVTDGMKLQLGDAELTILVTPGHTLGTISALVPVKDNGRTYVLSLLGGTAFPRTLEPGETMGGLLQFERSVERLAEASRQAGAVGLLNTHPIVDGSWDRLKQLRALEPGAENPFLLGTEKVSRYYGMFLACLGAAKLRPLEPYSGPPVPSTTGDDEK